MDQLAAIKAAMADRVLHPGEHADVNWLISEVERLRAALRDIADDGVEGYSSPQKRKALTALGEPIPDD